MEIKNKKEKKILTLNGINKHGHKRDFPYTKLEDKAKSIKVDIDKNEIRRITFDSVLDEKNYRVIVSKYKTGKKLENIFLSKNWEYDHTIVREDKKKYEINKKYEVLEVAKSYLDEIHTSKAKTVEGRVYIIIDGYGYNITKFARQEAKTLYEKILAGEGR